MLFKALYISFIQYLNNSVKKLDKNIYEVTYVINGRLYKLIIIPTRGPAPILQISDERGEDMTDKILPYMGPQYNWHGNKYLTPGFFNCRELNFELADGTEYSYTDKCSLIEEDVTSSVSNS